MPQQNANPQPAQTGIVASPNPTADDRQAQPNAAPKQVEGTPVQPATTNGAPMKTTKNKRSKHRKTKTSGD